MTSELRVDNLKGSTTGGSINVMSEGASVTTNLQQGLCKAWCRFDADASLDASLNISSALDLDTGKTQVFYTNNINSANDCVVTGMTQNNTDYGHTAIESSSFTGVIRLLSTQATHDRNNTMIHVTGDLA